MITFIPGDWLFQGTLIYLPSELSFDTINRKIAGVASVLVNDINIEFSENREAVAVWGLCPLSSWNRGSVPEPASRSGRIRVEEELTPGIAIRATPPGTYWPVTFDEASGWLYVGQEMLSGDQAIEFLEGCVVGLRHGKIVGLFLHPECHQ